jgi:DNA-binding beta-propeller fold protein YncE
LRLESAVDELPSSGRPLPRQHASGRPGRWLPWLAPVASVVTVLAVVIALVIVKSIPNGHVSPPATKTTAAAAKGVPRYYVAWMRADRPYLLVGDAATGTAVATVASPSGVLLDSAYGTADDDRTFVVTGDRGHGASAGIQWYLLRITPGAKTSARLVTLPIPVRQAPAGVAISPDGTKLAVALAGTPAVLRIYSVATGALLRTWTAQAGQIAVVKGDQASAQVGQTEVAKGDPGSSPFTAMTLRWAPDNSTLAFAWNATEIRSIETTAPNGNLLASSPLATIGTQYTPAGASVACDASQGWNLIAGAQGWAVICAGSWQAANAPSSSVRGTATSGNCAGSSPVTFGIDMQSPYGDNSGTKNSQVLRQPLATECSGQLLAGDGAYIDWSNASVMVGSLVTNGHSRFGIFSFDGTFTPLPALPISGPTPAGMPLGTDAW